MNKSFKVLLAAVVVSLITACTVKPIIEEEYIGTNFKAKKIYFAHDFKDIKTGSFDWDRFESNQVHVSREKLAFYKDSSIQELMKLHGYQLHEERLSTDEISTGVIEKEMRFKELTGPDKDQMKFTLVTNKVLKFAKPDVEKLKVKGITDGYLISISHEEWDLNWSQVGKSSAERYWVGRFRFVFWDIAENKLIGISYSGSQEKDKMRDGIDPFNLEELGDLRPGNKWSRITNNAVGLMMRQLSLY